MSVQVVEIGGVGVRKLAGEAEVMTGVGRPWQWGRHGQRSAVAGAHKLTRATKAGEIHRHLLCDCWRVCGCYPEM